MEIRRIKESDFNTIGQWWIDHGGKIPDKEFLPHKGTGGFIVSSKEKDIAAGYLYFTNASIAYVDFLISDKHYKEKDKHDAIVYLIDFMVKLGLKRGCKFVWATSKISGVVNKCKELGYDLIKGHTLIYKHK